MLNQTVTLERRRIDGRGSHVTVASYGGLPASIQGAHEYRERSDGEQVRADYRIYLSAEAPTINPAGDSNWYVIHGEREYEVIAASEVIDERTGALHHHRLLTR